MAAELVTVEARFVAAERGRAELQLLGLPDPVLRESRGRVLAALEEAGLRVPAGRLVLNLAPAGLQKCGETLDLALALASVAAVGHLPARAVERGLYVGELGIDARLRDVPGGFAAAEVAHRVGATFVVAPPRTAEEAALEERVEVRVARGLRPLVAWLAGGEALPVARAAPEDATPRTSTGGLAAVRGQGVARRALTIAAAGGHPLLLFGPPGTGKSLLARGLADLLPPPSLDERVELTRVRSAAGAWPKRLVAERPFRAPHHTTSFAGLVGGGSPPRPGEITLAHGGVLFLDELPEFKRSVLECLRQPLEAGEVTVARAARTSRYPARFLLVGAMNPCPCGYLGHPTRACRCGPRRVDAYRARLSGPLLDRFDLRVEVGAQQGLPPPEPDAEERVRVLADVVARARELAYAREQAALNGRLSPGELERVAPVDAEGRAFLERLADRLGLSLRGLASLRRVARTIADLQLAEAGASTRGPVALPHLREAAALRNRV